MIFTVISIIVILKYDIVLSWRLQPSRGIIILVHLWRAVQVHSPVTSGFEAGPSSAFMA